MSLAHHFWNGLCGHAESFSGIVKKKVDQTEGLNVGITFLGRKIIAQLLATNNGKRILIDIKHMSVTSRQDYYRILENHEAFKEVPLIVSHGAANGMQSPKKQKTNRF